MLPLLIGALWFGLAMVRTAVRSWSQWQQYQQLKLLSCADDTEPGLNWFPTAQSFACTAGLLKSEVFVARGLPRQLSTEQLDIVLAHEQAHTRQGDNLSRWLMNTACSLWPSVMAQPLLNRYALVTEQLADALVVRSTSATDIASTLVRVARLHRESPVNSSVHSPAHSSAHWSAFLSEAEPKALQIRVNQLLSPTVESSWLAFALLMVFFGLSLASVSSLDFLHHGV